MNKTLTKEIKVGMVLVVSVLILLLFFYKMGKFDFSKEGYRIKAVFDFAGGIAKNAPVRVLGVEVGKVEEIDLKYGEETQVFLTLWVDQRTKLREDAKAYVSMSGLMGGSYIELYPGSNDLGFLKEGSIIPGDDPFHSLMKTFTDRGEKLVNDLQAALANIKSLASNVDDIVIENKEEINNILQNVEVTTENLKELSSDLKNNPWKILTKPKDWKQRM